MNKKLGIVALMVFLSFIGILASLAFSINNISSSEDTLSPPANPNFSKARNVSNNSSFSDFRPPQQNDRMNMFLELMKFEIIKEQLVYLIPIILFTALGAVAVSYYVFHGKTEPGLKKQEARKALLAAFDKQEKEVIDLLLKNNGSVHQYELTRVSGMTKVQTHRLIEKMLAKGVISKKKIGKVNRIELSDELRVIL